MAFLLVQTCMVTMAISSPYMIPQSLTGILDAQEENRFPQKSE